MQGERLVAAVEGFPGGAAGRLGLDGRRRFNFGRRSSSSRERFAAAASLPTRATPNKPAKTAIGSRMHATAPPRRSLRRGGLPSFGNSALSSLFAISSANLHEHWKRKRLHSHRPENHRLLRICRTFAITASITYSIRRSLGVWSHLMEITNRGVNNAPLTPQAPLRDGHVRVGRSGAQPSVADDDHIHPIAGAGALA